MKYNAAKLLYAISLILRALAALPKLHLNLHRLFIALSRSAEVSSVDAGKSRQKKEKQHEKYS
jgi:hypothetical protein